MSKKHTLLIIDDIVDNLMLLGEAMSSEYKIKVATGGVQGLELAVQSPKPDLILLDIMMPGIDGYEVCRRLKADRRTRHIPVIFLSALDKESDELQGLDAGAVDFITKPFKLEVVRARINTQLELLRMRQQLQTARLKAEAASQSKSVFLANMSHEIRTPMSAIMGMTDLALEKASDSQQRSYLETVKLSADSLLALINDILDFSKIEAGKLELERTVFDLRDLMETVIRPMRLRAEDKGLYLHLEISPDIHPFLMGDPVRLQQILLNFLNNAVKFTERGGVTVRIAAQEEDDESLQLKMSVHDTGIGIPAERMDRLFHSFSQADASTSRKYGGTGLGLAICRRLSKLMDGEVGVTSEQGRGSTFRCTVSVRKASRDAFITTKEQTGFHNFLPAAPDLLLVEDNKVNQYVALSILKKIDLVADVAENGVQALEMLRKKEYDLVLMDIQMPEMDGFEATRYIRNPDSGVLRPDVPIIAMTADATKEDRDKCFAAGMNDYIPKPVNREHLFSVLQQQLSREQTNIPM
ncbi:MAG: response regulator, partial [Candidatus Electrothrix sp. LOE2]|nr:response regulator [Candidatus Electrothrix sp. LOE2]